MGDHVVTNKELNLKYVNSLHSSVSKNNPIKKCEDLNGHFSKRYNQQAVKRCLISLVLGNSLNQDCNGASTSTGSDHRHQNLQIINAGENFLLN